MYVHVPVIKDIQTARLQYMLVSYWFLMSSAPHGPPTGSWFSVKTSASFCYIKITQFFRPTRSSYIRIYDGNGTEVIRLNAATSPDVIFPQNTQGRVLTFRTTNFIFTEKRSYYVLFDPGGCMCMLAIRYIPQQLIVWFTVATVESLYFRWHLEISDTLRLQKVS